MENLILYDHRASICSQMARLALVEKELQFQRHQIDIMETSEQFEPWYVALNPKAVVPTVAIGDEIVTDTIHIVNRAQEMPGPDLSGDDSTQKWLLEIMKLHYGVLLYRKRLDPDGTAPQVLARAEFLKKLSKERPDLREVISARLEGNRRFQAILADPQAVQQHVGSARALIDAMNTAVEKTRYIAGENYSLADCFATAALARFTIHQFQGWWSGTALQEYYERMKARPSFIAAEMVETGTERDL
ncbi:MAG: glutathione S-transferase family protein [Rhizobiaceae bacterium]